MKYYVIDTNVLVHDYNSFDKILKDNIVIIPYIVLEELDKLKTKSNEVGVNARHVIKRIEEEILEDNDSVKIISTDEYIDKLPDDKIIEVCISHLPAPVLISKDVCLRTKARAKGIEVQDYKDDKVQVQNLYDGFAEEVFTESSTIGKAYNKQAIKTEEYFYPNQVVPLVNSSNPVHKCYTIHSKGKLRTIDTKLSPFGLECANLEQQVLANLMLDPSISLITVTGRSGSGKTLISIASALEAVLEQNLYDKMTVARPIMAFQQDIGFLPGDLNDKINPWLMPIVDNLDFLFSMDEQQGAKKRGKLSPFEELQEQGVLEVCALTYIRGRSIPNQFIIIDEAQQMTKEEMKTILTRAGKNTKIVLTGDYEQIDNPYLSADNNGLVYCVETFKKEEIAAHISLKKCERSELAEVASRIMT